MTLKEIAKRANVSTSTVSRIINSKDNSFASESVRNRVWEIIKETGYVPNRSARSLRLTNGETVKTISSKTIACIFARTKNPIDNPFFSHVARAIEQQALSMEYVVAYSFSTFDIDDISVLNRITSNTVDGVVVLGRFSNEIMLFLKRHYKNIVYVGLNSIDVSWDQVICDGYDAAITAMRYLIEGGHKKIAYVGETTNEVRYTAYFDALSNANLPFDKKLVSDCDSSGTGGYYGAEELLRNNPDLPDAIFCTNDITAITAMKYLREKGIKSPKDISIVGIDDIEIAQFVSPMLTTVSIPKNELGQMAVKVLVDRIEKGHRLAMKVVLPHKLIVRESSKKS